MPLTIMIMARVIAKPITATPVSESMSCLKSGVVSAPNVVSIVVSKVKIETAPAISEIVFAAE